MTTEVSPRAPVPAYRKMREWYQWLHWLDTSPRDRQRWWRINRVHIMRAPSLGFGEFSHLSNLLLEDDAFAEPLQQLRTSWSSLFQGNREEASLRQLQRFCEQYFQAKFTSGNYLPCNWVYAGLTPAQRGGVTDTVTPHLPNITHWTLHLTVRGSGCYEDGGHRLVTGPGDLILIPPNVTVHYRRAECAAVWDHQWIAFQPRESWLPWMEWLGNPIGIRHLLLTEPQRAQALELMESVVSVRADSEGIKYQLQMNRLEELLIRATEWHSTPTVDEKSVVSQACRFIRNNFHQPISVEEVARVCNLSSSRLAHLFAEQMGIAPMALRDELRLMRAREMLGNSTERIGSIAAQVGYRDQLYFSKVFKRKVGYTPSRYRALQTAVPAGPTATSRH